MRRKQNRCASPGAQLFEKLLNVAAALWIESSRWLVEQQQRRIDHERSRDTDLLLHATAHLFERRRELCPFEAQPFQDLHGALLSVRGLLSVKQRGVEQVLARGQFLIERGVDTDASDDAAHLFLLRRQRVSHQADFAFVSYQQRRQNTNQA